MNRSVWAVIASIIAVVIILALIYWFFGSIFRPLAVDSKPDNNPDQISLAPNSEVVKGVNDVEEEELGSLYLVSIANNSLDEANIKVNDGDTVMWINKDKISYEYESEAEFDVIEPYSAYSITYINPGTYNYNLTNEDTTINGSVEVTD